MVLLAIVSSNVQQHKSEFHKWYSSFLRYTQYTQSISVRCTYWKLVVSLSTLSYILSAISIAGLLVEYSPDELSAKYYVSCFLGDFFLHFCGWYNPRAPLY